jgi:ATP-dependent DNA helicase RecQ
MAVRSALLILERAGHLERGSPNENLATITPARDLVAYLDRHADESQPGAVLRALLSDYNWEAGQPTQVNLARVADNAGLARDQAAAVLGRLQAAGALRYRPAFQGRGIRLLDEEPTARLRINRQELARRAANEQLKLRKMIDFAYHKGCLRNFILSYFQDRHDRQPCGQCSICRPVAFAQPTRAAAVAADGTLTLKRRTGTSPLDRFIIESAPTGQALRAELKQRSEERRAAALPEPRPAAARLTPEDCLTVRKILSCVARLNGRFGKGMVANVLRGSRAKAVLAGKLDELSTYGLLSHMTVEEIGRWIELLQTQQLIVVSAGAYPTVSLTEQGRAVMKGTEIPQFAPPS